MADEALPECVDCGACCLAPEENPHEARGGYVWVSRRERTKLLEAGHAAAVVPTRYLSTQGHALKVKETPTGKACIFLRGEVGRFCHCGIYPIRPKVCRQFQRGSPPCLEARAEFLKRKETA